MRKIGFALLLVVFIIAAANNTAHGKSFDRCLKDFGAVLDEVRAYMDRYRQEQKDIKLLAEVIYWENWYTDKDHLAAYYTGAVVMNRVHSDKWPDTIHDVLYQKGQYSTTKYFYTETLPEEVYTMAADIIRNGTPDVPEAVVFQSMRALGKVWKKVNTDYFCYGDA